MKLSSNLISILIFLAITTAVFIWMAMRPAVDGNAMIFGMPNSNSASNTVETMAKEADTTSTESSSVEQSSENDEEKVTDEAVNAAPNSAEGTSETQETTPTQTEEKPADSSMPSTDSGTSNQ